jgi:hypothetical protein
MSLLDIHDNVNHHAVVYGGSSNNGALEMAFTVSAVRTNSTQYILNVVLFGATSVTRMQFFLLLIGNEATGLIQALTFSFSDLIQFQPPTFSRPQPAWATS